MPESQDDLCDRLVAEIDHALASIKAAMLTEDQYGDIRRLRDDVQRLCEKSKYEEAEQATKVALAIIKEGPPER